MIDVPGKCIISATRLLGRELGGGGALGSGNNGIDGSPEGGWRSLRLSVTKRSDLIGSSLSDKDEESRLCLFDIFLNFTIQLSIRTYLSLSSKHIYSITNGKPLFVTWYDIGNGRGRERGLYRAQ